MNKFALLLCMLISVSGPAGAAEDCRPADEKYRVVFGNGILVSMDSAAASQEVLRDALGSTHNGQKVEYDLAYNFTVGPFSDLIQALDQHLAQYTREALQWLYGVGVVPQWFHDMQERLLSAHYQSTAPELTDHIQKYREAILQGRKVLVVSHSQGNFYVNQARQLLEGARPGVPMDSFGIFSVATPANQVGGAAGPYLTNHRDIIRLVPGSLPQNWTLHGGGAVADDRNQVLAHSFVDTYLSGDFDIRPEVLAGIRLRMDALQDPPTVMQSGVVTATMVWDVDDTDIDMHIVEPDGTHVSYLDLEGTSGVLDVDNTKGYGPEHYYSDCNQLQVGEYRFGMNYFSDNLSSASAPTRPVPVTFTVSVPGDTRVFSQTLTSEENVWGNDKAIPVARVTVERISDPGNPNRDGLLKYRIDPA